MPVFEDLDQALRYIRQNAIEMIDLKFCDRGGDWHHVTLPADQFGLETM